MHVPEVAVHAVDACARSWGREGIEKGARKMHVDAEDVVGKEQAAGRAWKRTKTCESLSQRHTAGSAMHGSIVRCERKRENGAKRSSCGRQSGLARLAPQPNFTDGTANAVPNVHLHPQAQDGARTCTDTAGEGDELVYSCARVSSTQSKSLLQRGGSRTPDTAGRRVRAGLKAARENGGCRKDAQRQCA